MVRIVSGGEICKVCGQWLMQPTGPKRTDMKMSIEYLPCDSPRFPSDKTGDRQAGSR